jgi:hypothetical protein
MGVGCSHERGQLSKKQCEITAAHISNLGVAFGATLICVSASAFAHVVVTDTDVATKASVVGALACDAALGRNCAPFVVSCVDYVDVC